MVRELYCRTAALPEVDAVGFNCMSVPSTCCSISSLWTWRTSLSPSCPTPVTRPSWAAERSIRACRDRSLNATKALLLGLAMEGVRNVLLVTGDPILTEERDEIKSVFNFNSRKLARYVSGLNDSTLQRLSVFSAP